MLQGEAFTGANYRVGWHLLAGDPSISDLKTDDVILCK